VWGTQTAEEIPPDVMVWLGLDLGWKNDTTAAVPLWMRRRAAGTQGRASTTAGVIHLWFDERKAVCGATEANHECRNAEGGWVIVDFIFESTCPGCGQPLCPRCKEWARCQQSR
jgi:hypothetical protein